LLHDVRQLVRKRFSLAPTSRSIGPVPKEDILPASKRLGLQRAIQLVRPRVRVYSDATEIRPQGLLQAAAQGLRQRLAPAPRLVDGGFQVWGEGRITFLGLALHLRLHQQRFLVVLLLTLHRVAGCGQWLGVQPLDDLLRHAVGFPLVAVARWPNHQPRLHRHLSVPGPSARGLPGQVPLHELADGTIAQGAVELQHFSGGERRGGL